MIEFNADEIRARAEGHRLVVSLSGGKDSTAMALLLTECGVPFEAIFMDTGWEHPVLYTYLDEVIEPLFGPITRLRSKRWPGGMRDMVLEKGAFPSRTMRFCTEQLKFIPMRDHLLAIDDEVVNAIGIRAAESANRAKMPEWEWSDDIDAHVWRPLLKWSYDDVIEMHHRHGVAPNPLYLQGASRVGCFPCIFARKSEVASVARLWPGRVDEIEALEVELTARIYKRRAEEPEYEEALREKAMIRLTFLVAQEDHPALRWKPFKRDQIPAEVRASLGDYRAEVRESDVAAEMDRMSERLYFHGRTGEGGIRDVVEWAKTTRGGKQYPLFDLTADDGCMRWGMCDAAAEQDLVVVGEPKMTEAS